MEVRLAPDPQLPDARILSACLVPYGQVTDIVDMGPDGAPDRYQEAFALGAFQRQVEAAQANGGVARRVTFVDQHMDGLGKLGYALSLREEPTGLFSDLRVLPPFVATVETQLADGVDGLSIGFVPLRTQRQADGVRLRTRASLIHVALEAQPAYQDAKVLAMRAAQDAADEEAAAQREAEQWRAELDAWLAQNAERQEALHSRIQPVS